MIGTLEILGATLSASLITINSSGTLIVSTDTDLSNCTFSYVKGSTVITTGKIFTDASNSFLSSLTGDCTLEIGSTLDQ